jgi:hypothetical protein
VGRDDCAIHVSGGQHRVGTDHLTLPGRVQYACPLSAGDLFAVDRARSFHCLLLGIGRPVLDISMWVLDMDVGSAR